MQGRKTLHYESNDSRFETNKMRILMSKWATLTDVNFGK